MRRFAFRLALELGYINVDQMLSEIDSRMLSEWLAFSQLEPFGYQIHNWRMGTVCSAVANWGPRNLKKSVTAFDFMPKTPEEKLRTAYLSAKTHLQG